MRKRILLVEPGYRNKYPPLGLMKLATYHQEIKKDEVYFVKGTRKLKIDISTYDRIYVTTLFTFYWKQTIKTIEYFLKRKNDKCKIYVGGIMSSILAKEIKEYFDYSQVVVVKGIINDSKVLGYRDKTNIDNLTPDYAILDLIDYKYKHSNDYMIFTTRGCVRKCEFCVVPKIEPKFGKVNDLLTQITSIEKAHGTKHNLIIMDNNILALPFRDLELLVNQIIELGYRVGENWYYYVDEKGKNRKRHKYVDFNQGVDARLLTEKKMALLSKIAVRPLRIAFDHAEPKFIELYTGKIRLAHKYGIKYLSNYVLFNFEDSIDDFYNRARINVELNEELGTKIFSFPMKYSPILGDNNTDRKYVGNKWSKKELRGVQCILAATHGVIGPRMSYFLHAFGSTITEFKFLLNAPERYIIYRNDNMDKLSLLKTEFLQMSKSDQTDFLDGISCNDYSLLSKSFKKRYHSLLEHYEKNVICNYRIRYPVSILKIVREEEKEMVLCVLVQSLNNSVRILESIP